MFKLTKQGSDTIYGVKEYVVDTAADLASIPPCIQGSVALDISTSDVYMKNSAGEWVKL